MILYSVVCDQCAKLIIRSGDSQGKTLKRARKVGIVTKAGDHFCVMCAIDQGLLIRCEGAAHVKGEGGGHIDHCEYCGEHWGWMEPRKEVVTL